MSISAIVAEMDMERFASILNYSNRTKNDSCLYLFNLCVIIILVAVCATRTGARERFFVGGGGKNVDMPSDCQNLGGHRHIHPIETKKLGGGNCPPGSRAPEHVWHNTNNRLYPVP